MVSKEPNHLLTGQTNGKSQLTDKLPGTMTVRSVLLNRDSPDIESHLKRRRNRTHQVRFKDLEDGSSSSGNSGTGENNSHQRTPKDCDSPNPLYKHCRSPQPWSRDGPRTNDLPGQTSVVGAVRGDMASTIEVVAAFLARAPPHPLTPGPTRRCWAPPQTNSLTLPMTRRTCTSTSTAIQTSPCLKKPPSLSSTHTRSHSLGDSVGIDGDDEHDSQDEYLSHNHVSVLPASRNQNGPPGPRDKTVVERKSKACRTDLKSAVSVVKNSRHNCTSALNSSQPCRSSPVSICDGPKRQGSSTPSVVRRRKRLNRTTSDPGKEVHYCTTPTQTETQSLIQPPSNTKLCTTQVQTESPSSCQNSKYCTAQSQTENHQPSSVTDKQCTTPLQTTDTTPALPPSVEQCSTQIQTDSPCRSPPNTQPSTARTKTHGLSATPPLKVSSVPVKIHSEPPTQLPTRTQDPPITKITTVPYATSALSTGAPTQTTEHRGKPPCSSFLNSVSPTTPPLPITVSICSTSPTPTCVANPITQNTVVSTETTPSCSTVVSSSPSLIAPPLPTPDPIVVSASPLSCSTPTPTVTTATPDITPPDSIGHLATVPDLAHGASHNSTTLPSNLTPCTFVTQTALSCTSIAYYTTTPPHGHHAPLPNSTTPSYAAVIQTVSHCNIPYQTVTTSLPLYSTHVSNFSKSCTSPASNLLNAQPSVTPTKAVPLYSSKFRAAPPYTPPSQASFNAQDKRGIRLPPPPPPPPPPYTPRKKGNDKPGPGTQTPKLRADSKADEKEKKENVKSTDSPKLNEQACSQKHRAQTSPVPVMKGEKEFSSSSPAKACFKTSCLSSAQAQLGALHKMLCSGANARPSTPNSQHRLPPDQQGCSGAKGCSSSRPLTPTQADTLRQVQEILGGLVAGAKCKLDPSRVTEKLLSPNGPLHDIRSLQSQLHSLEGVLETSQNTIKVLLDVIQDLEKKEAERDG